MESYWKVSIRTRSSQVSISSSLSLDGSDQLKQSAKGLRVASRSTMHVDTNALLHCCIVALLQCVATSCFLLDALIDNSPQDVRQGRHPASHKIYMGGASNQLTNGCWSIGLDTSTSIQVCSTKKRSLSCKCFKLDARTLNSCKIWPVVLQGQTTRWSLKSDLLSTM